MTVVMPLRILDALAPVSPVLEATTTVSIFSLFTYFSTIFRRASVFCLPDFPK